MSEHIIYPRKFKTLNEKRLFNELVGLCKNILKEKLNIKFVYDQTQYKLYVKYTCVDIKSLYYGGEYLFMLGNLKVLPNESPLLNFLTPSGRFQIDKRPCMCCILESQWHPVFTFCKIISSVISILENPSINGTDFINESDAKKQSYAKSSQIHNLEHNNEILKMFKEDEFPTEKINDTLRYLDSNILNENIKEYVSSIMFKVI